MVCGKKPTFQDQGVSIYPTRIFDGANTNPVKCWQSKSSPRTKSVNRTFCSHSKRLLNITCTILVHVRTRLGMVVHARAYLFMPAGGSIRDERPRTQPGQTSRQAKGQVLGPCGGCARGISSVVGGRSGEKQSHGANRPQQGWAYVNCVEWARAGCAQGCVHRDVANGWLLMLATGRCR